MAGPTIATRLFAFCPFGVVRAEGFRLRSYVLGCRLHALGVFWVIHVGFIKVEDLGFRLYSRV